MIYLVGGVVFAVLLGGILDKYQCYKKTVQFICLLTILTNSVHFFTLPSKIFPLELILMMLIGIFAVPITPVAFAFTVELTFPVPEALSNGMMLTLGLLWSTGEGVL